MFQNVYSGKKVLVTGHTGFKGSWLTTWLLHLGAKVAGYSIDIPTNPSHFETIELKDEITHYIGDILDYENFLKCVSTFRPDFIFHLAAQPLVRESFLKPRETFYTNTLGTLNVLEAIRKNIAFIKAGIIITSDKCYENFEWLYGYRENDALGGDDPYSGSKSAAELIAKSYMASFFKSGYPKICTTRAGNVIGGGDWAKDRIVPDLVRSWTENKLVEIRNPFSTRPWQHVLEPLSGYLCLGAHLYKGREDISNQAFNFGPNSSVNKTVGELIETFSSFWPNSAGWKFVKNQNKTINESTLLKLNCDKANILLNWYPTLDFSSTIKFTADWYMSFKNGFTNSKEPINLTISQIKKFTKIAQNKKIEWALK